MAQKKKVTIASPHRTFLLIALIGIAIGYLFGGILVQQPQAEIDDQSNISATNDQLEKILEEEMNSDQDIEQLTFIENVSVDDDPDLGVVNAPITIIEFSDYQCPFCKKFFDESHKTIIKEYVDTGKVHYVYRDFPLDSHPQAVPAAVAANCAGEQERYWEMHNLLLENQDEWSFNVAALQMFEGYASTIGLDPAEFATCIEDNEEMVQEILHDQEDGTAATVQQTPTIFINGKKIVGAQPLETYIAIIEGELLN